MATIIVVRSFLYSYFSSHKHLSQVLIYQVTSLPRVVNIIRDVKGSRNTACGHNDFCSVRLNGPICAKVSCPSGCCRITLLQFQQHLHCLQWFLLQICCFSFYNWQILPLMVHNLTICIYCQHKIILFQYMIHLSNIAI